MGRLLLPHLLMKVGGIPPWALQQFVEPREQAAFGTSVVSALVNEGRRGFSLGSTTIR